MTIWKYAVTTGAAGAFAAAAFGSTIPAPAFGFATPDGPAALPAASAIGLGLLIGGVTVAGLFFLWRNRR